MKIVRTAALFLLAFTACQTPEEREVLQVLESQQRAWNAGSVEGYMEGYWNSEELTFVSGGTVTRGYSVVSERYSRSYDSAERMGQLAFSDVRVEFFSSTAAIVTGEWRLRRRSDEPWGRFTLVLKKMPEGWKIVYDHTSVAVE